MHLRWLTWYYYAAPHATAEIACGTDGFGTLCQILKDTELYEALDGSDMLTTFAPTDEAFTSFIGMYVLSTDALTYIALGHVTSGSIKAEDLPCVAGENLTEMRTSVPSARITKNARLSQHTRSVQEMPMMPCQILPRCTSRHATVQFTS